MTSTAHKMNRGPLILAIILLLLPVLYVGSYLALVVPGNGVLIPATGRFGESGYLVRHYRHGGELAERIYWPLEQIDRRVRLEAWEPFYLEQDRDF